MAVTSSVNIDAPPDKVWSVLADLGSIYKWNPGVAKSHTTSELTQGEGATRHCDLDDKNYLEERAFDWREGESFKIDVFESTLPL
ncbi:MAG: SRPBCC family protein, partial [Chloroflexi bacterium]|nr:SRPBCC family protein [Chloroflexota bacterium]